MTWYWYLSTYLNCPKIGPSTGESASQVNLAKGIELIPGCNMQAKPASARALLNSMFQDRMEELHGIPPKEKPQRGKKIRLLQVRIVQF